MSFVTWLHLEAPPENIKKINNYQLSNIELVLTQTVLELGFFCIARKLLVPFVTLCKKFQKNLKIYYSRIVQNPIDHNMVDGNFKD